MDRVVEYRDQVQKLLQTYMDQRPIADGVETELIVDAERNHYQLVNVGWLNNRRIYGCVLHIDIKGDKVWIQHNGTEREVAEELAALGIPKDRIVIGFHSPFRRGLTEFAVN